MKKALIGISVFLLAFTAFACVVLNTPNKILYLLNWGEYIDSSLVKEFEEEFHCQVIEENVTSSEAMYQKISGGTTTYDVAIPGDYAISRLQSEDLLRKLDVNNPSYVHLSGEDSQFDEGLQGLMNEYMVNPDSGESIQDYFKPYFWGAYSLIYSNNKTGLEAALQENGFSCLYDRALLPEGAKTGMYDTARWIVASYLLSQGLDPNLTDRDGSKEGDISPSLQQEIIASVKKAGFSELANDALKRDVANGRIDVCFAQLGDYFDGLYLLLNGNSDPSHYRVFVPKVTSAFFDGMVIPSTCQNYDLANAFINFMLDESHAYQNARAIGYSPCLKAVKEEFEEEAKRGGEYYPGLSMEDFLASYPNYLNPLFGVETCYMFEAKSKDYLTTCETILNNLSL